MTFGCFVLANIFSTLMVQAEARNRAVLGGTFEGIFALFWIVAARYSIIALGYHNAWDVVFILTALFAGNFVGAFLGVKVGERYITDEDDEALQKRVAETEAFRHMTEQTLTELEAEIDAHHADDSSDSHDENHPMP